MGGVRERVGSVCVGVRMSDIYGKGARGKATRLHAQIVRARGACESCGGTSTLQCAHIISRRYASTRTDLDNAFCLCAGCHRRYTEWPLEFHSFVLERIGEDGYRTLRKKALEVKKVDWDVEAARLDAIWKAMV